MRPDTPGKTNITSLAATAGAAAFVVWVVSVTTQPDSLYAQAPTALRSAQADVSASRPAPDAAPSTDQAVSRGQG